MLSQRSGPLHSLVLLQIDALASVNGQDHLRAALQAEILQKESMDMSHTEAARHSIEHMSNGPPNPEGIVTEGRFQTHLVAHCLEYAYLLFKQFQSPIHFPLCCLRCRLFGWSGFRSLYHLFLRNQFDTVHFNDGILQHQAMCEKQDGDLKLTPCCAARASTVVPFL